MSDNKIQLVKLDENKNIAYIGKWEADKSDGGSHLNDGPFEKDNSKKTWATNPKYFLLFKEPAPPAVSVKITLVIAEKDWKAKTKVLFFI